MYRIRVPRRTEGSRTRRGRAGMALAGGLALAALGASSVATADSESGQAELAEVRAATAQFHRIAAAENAGHQLGWKAPFLINGCVAKPGTGAMGYHWFNHEAIEDIALDPMRPEGLVYESLPNGSLH